MDDGEKVFLPLLTMKSVVLADGKEEINGSHQIVPVSLKAEIPSEELKVLRIGGT